MILPASPIHVPAEHNTLWNPSLEEREGENVKYEWSVRARCVGYSIHTVGIVCVVSHCVL